jgi:hypothetical protein
VFAQKRGLRRGRSDRSPGNTHPGVVSGSERVGGKCLDAGVPRNRPHIGAAHDTKRFGQRRLLAAGCLGKIGKLRPTYVRLMIGVTRRRIRWIVRAAESSRGSNQRRRYSFAILNRARCPKRILTSNSYNQSGRN